MSSAVFAVTAGTTPPNRLQWTQLTTAPLVSGVWLGLPTGWVRGERSGLSKHDWGIQFMDVNSIQIGGTHYKEMEIQPWDAMKAWMPKEAFEGYLRGAAIKYLARYDRKGGIEDVRKARHYLDALIESMEGSQQQAPAKAPIRAPETFSEPAQYLTRRDVPRAPGGGV